MSNTRQEGDYIPYGPEWEAELMKHNKKSLIDLYRRQLTSQPTVEELKQKFAHYIGGDRYTYDQLDTSERDTLEWVLKNL